MSPEQMQYLMGLAMLQLRSLVTPMHDFLQGERNYFLAQGYTADEARAMSAATYVAVFGSAIPRRDDQPGEEPGRS